MTASRRPRLEALTRAYGGTAKLALDAAGISRMRLWAVLAVPCPYALYERKLNHSLRSRTNSRR